MHQQKGQIDLIQFPPAKNYLLWLDIVLNVLNQSFRIKS